MHRHKASTTSLQDLTAQENTAQDSQVVKNRVPGTLEMAQAEPQKHLLPNQHFRLVVCLPRRITLQPLADGNLWQANILHHGPDDRHTAGFGREDVDLIAALPHIAQQAFNRLGAANGTVHDWWKGIKGQQMLFIFDEAAHRFWIALAIFGECSPPD